MEKIVGRICIGKKSTYISFNVKWDSDEETAWIYILEIWVLVCSKVKSTDEALSCAQNFFNFQYSTSIMKKCFDLP